MLSPIQIRDDLRGAFRGRLLFDPPTRGLYATDASPFEIVPHGVAVPLDEDDLRALVKYAQETQLPLVARGAGTGLAGESLGFGLIVDLSVNFRRVLEIGDDAVVVQPGVTHAALNAALARHGRRFAPHPASSRTCTLGGMIATNASGGTVFRHGYTRDHVQALRVVWDDGTADTVPSATPAERTIDIRSQTAALIAENRDLIQVTRPHTRFNRCGYVLHDVLTPGGLDLVKLLVGSEGTLGFVTEATLRTIPTAGGTCLALLGFATIEEAVRAGLGLHSVEGIVGCDLLDQRLLAVSRVADPEYGVGLIPPTVGAALIVIVEAETERGALAQGKAAVERVRDAHRVGVLAAPTSEPDGRARIARFRDSAVSGVYSFGAGPRPLPCIEDIAVPTDELGRFLAGVRDLLKQFDLTASTHAHVLSGQVHTRPFVDASNPDELAKLWPLAEAIHGLALTLGGTVSTQHGTGLARTPWVEKQYGALMPIFRELKRIFDPVGLLNPGKIVGPDPSRPAWPLRVGARGKGQGASSEPEAEQRVPLPVTELNWGKSDPATVAAACNGCGDCRTRNTGERMCPVFRATNDEAATPRAKANLFRQLLAQPDAVKEAEQLWAVADLCVNCKMCRDECRAKVDIPKLMLETKARLYAEHGLARGDWLPARTDGLAAFASSFAFTANTLLGRRSARWLFEKMFGLSRRLLVPKLARQSFLRRARKAGWSRPQTREPSGSQNVVVPGPGLSPFDLTPAASNKVAYFVDTFANRFDPSIGDAAVAVLRHHGFEVHVPRRQRASGMNPLAYGDAELAREIAASNVRTLADLVRDGYHVVCTEPTAAVAITQDYLDLLDDADARLVAANTSELTAYLWRLHEAGRLRTEFRPLDVTLGHHVPCHVKALPGMPGPRLLELIPGVRVRTIDVGCSGMAGTWGLRARTRDASLAAGADMLGEFDRPGVLFGSTECGACRVQMQDATRKRTLHPIQYLALAYGLMPELADRLTKPLGKLVTD